MDDGSYTPQPEAPVPADDAPAGPLCDRMFTAADLELATRTFGWR